MQDQQGYSANRNKIDQESTQSNDPYNSISILAAQSTPHSSSVEKSSIDIEKFPSDHAERTGDELLVRITQ